MLCVTLKKYALCQPLKSQLTWAGNWKLLIMSCQTECIWKIESVATWIEQSCILLLSYFRPFGLLALRAFKIILLSNLLTLSLMMAIPESCCARLIWYLSFYCIVYLWVFNIDILTIIFDQKCNHETKMENP